MGKESYIEEESKQVLHNLDFENKQISL